MEFHQAAKANDVEKMTQLKERRVNINSRNAVSIRPSSLVVVVSYSKGSPCANPVCNLSPDINHPYENKTLCLHTHLSCLRLLNFFFYYRICRKI